METSSEFGLRQVARTLTEIETELDQVMKKTGRLISAMVDVQSELELGHSEGQPAFAQVTKFLIGISDGRKTLIMAHGMMRKIAKTRSDLTFPSERISGLRTLNHEAIEVAEIRGPEIEQIAA
jgi:hypothetical protein